MQTNQPATWTEELRRRLPWRRPRGDNAGVDYVDPQAVFVCGHSAGGSLTILSCLLPSPFRAGSDRQ